MITILLPTDGKRNSLNFVIDSILNQKYKDIELIILSSFNEITINKDDNRIKIVKVPEDFWGYWGHKAVRWALNNLELKGDWLYIIGDDDILCEWGLWDLINNSEGMDMVSGLVVPVKRDNHDWSNRLLGEIIEHGQITGQCCIYKMSKVRECGYIEDKYEADWILINDMRKYPYKKINSIITVMPCL